VFAALGIQHAMRIVTCALPDSTTFVNLTLGQIKKTNAQICKGFKNNTNFGKISGIQEKLDTTCK